MPEVIIIGAGVIACSIAYQTSTPSLRGTQCRGNLIAPTEIASAGFASLAMTGRICHSEPQLVGKKNLTFAQVCPDPSRRVSGRRVKLSPLKIRGERGVMNNAIDAEQVAT